MYNKFSDRESRINKGDKLVSFTQFSLYLSCPKAWELSYIKKLLVYKESIHSLFGTAVHNTIQLFLKTLYLESVKKADSLDLPLILKDRMVELYKKATEQIDHFSSPEELSTFWTQGCQILKTVKSKRRQFFDQQSEELIGIEMPLIVPLNQKTNLKFRGFLDFIAFSSKLNRYYLRDFKTSTKGWSDYQKKDIGKYSQVILYRLLLEKHYKIPNESVEGSFLILKRQIDEDSQFPQKRVVEFIPTQGTTTVSRVQKEFIEFLHTAYNLEEGTYNEQNNFPAYKSSACMFCQFKDRQDLCPVERRLQKVI